MQTTGAPSGADSATWIGCGNGPSRLLSTTAATGTKPSSDACTPHVGRSPSALSTETRSRSVIRSPTVASGALVVVSTVGRKGRGDGPEVLAPALAVVLAGTAIRRD
ncbi:hypothetical protein [Leifsonia aquatica]|uniref:Uncharacterized protein n=1 Tax=Leifsonia aquatica TaxID=144185 RepID=A0A7W4UZH3_LEIAQ|nr:hypothetical protein [Leifsonia aquatica]MBB2969131.1 hypothetical protein [Leifsonia aquatica]